MDARDRRRQGTSRIVELHRDDGSFDREFWRNIPAQERLEAVWSLTLECLGDQPRLQRSVCRVVRRAR